MANEEQDPGLKEAPASGGLPAPPRWNLLGRLKAYKRWWELPNFVLILLATVAGANSYIDWRIDQKLANEALLKKIGQSARPFCIFDNKSRIQYDSGAMQFIGSTVSLGKDCFNFANFNKAGFPQEVTVHFNRLFNSAPTLAVIGQGMTTSTAKRGPGYDWVYTIYTASLLETEAGTSPPPSDEQDYRLDILF